MPPRGRAGFAGAAVFTRLMEPAPSRSSPRIRQPSVDPVEELLASRLDAPAPPRLLGEPPRRNSRVANVDEQPLGGVEQRLFRRRAGTRLRGFRQRLRLRASRRASLARPTYATTVTVAAPAGTS